MGYLYSIAIMIISSTYSAFAQSTLLENVKNNPKEAEALCQQFRDLNSKGISASSQEAIQQISTQKNLSTPDAEVLSIYVIGLNCPEVN